MPRKRKKPSKPLASASAPGEGQHPKYLRDFMENVKEVTHLFSLSQMLQGPGVPPAARPLRAPLNKSGLVLLIACWEAFVEDLASDAFDRLHRSAGAPASIPTKVLAEAATHVLGPDPRGVWRLAGEGWRKVLSQHRDTLLRDWVGGLHTPNHRNIDQLFQSLLGIRRLSSNWKWQGRSAASSRSDLMRLIERRGAIAHRVSVKPAVTGGEGQAAIRLIGRLAMCSASATEAHLAKVLDSEECLNFRMTFKPQPHRGRLRKASRSRTRARR